MVKRRNNTIEHLCNRPNSVEIHKRMQKPLVAYILMRSTLQMFGQNRN